MGSLRSAAVLGTGAVGGYFGAKLARAGVPVTMIGRPAQVEAIARSGLTVVGAEGEWQAKVAASAETAAVRDADLLLLAVKSHDTDRAAAGLRGHLPPRALVVSLQNGVDNAARIAAALPNPVYAAVVYVGADTEAPGRVRHTGRGDLVIGRPRDVPVRGDAAADLAAVSRLFEAAGVPCPVSGDIDAALWTKLALNCALNPVSALEQSRYGVMASHVPTRGLMEGLLREAVAVARAEGVNLDADALVGELWKLMAAMPAQQSSMAQDLQRGRRTEIDALNGHVARRGAALGVEAPLNRAMHALVQAREAREPLDDRARVVHGASPP